MPSSDQQSAFSTDQAPSESISARRELHSPIRIGVIGVGFGQQVLVPAFRLDQRCQVAAVCASTTKKAKEVAEKLSIEKSYGSWSDLLQDSQIEAISIATQPALQAEIAMNALASGKAVLCEKPLALTVEASQQLVEAARAAGVANMIDFEFPEIASWKRAREILLSGELGNLRHVSVSWHVETYANKYGISSWKGLAAEGGGSLSNFVSHVFYNLEWLLGRISKLSSRLSRAPGDSRDGDTVAILSLVLESGLAISVSVCSSAFLGGGHRLEFYGDNATMLLLNSSSDYVSGFQLMLGSRSSNRLEFVDTRNQDLPANSDGRISAVAPLIKRFISWIDDSIPSAPCFSDGLRVSELIAAARLSNETGCLVDCHFQA